MKKLLIAFAATTMIAGAAHAQQGSATQTDQQTDATTVPAQEAAPMTSTDAPRAGRSPTATEAESDATTAHPRIVPQTGTDAPPAGENPTATEAESDATTVPAN